MKKTINNQEEALEYARRQIYNKIGKIELSIKYITPFGAIKWMPFDKEQCDKKLLKNIKRIYGRSVDLSAIWEEELSKCQMYVQCDFMYYPYNLQFYNKGKYSDYGYVFFYENKDKENTLASYRLIGEWFNECVMKRYNTEKEKFDRTFPLFREKKFVMYQRWDLIAKAAMHYNSRLTKEEIKEKICNIAKSKNLKILSMDDYEIVFE